MENKRINNFLEELFELYKKHDLSIAHEDDQGGFIIESYKSENIEWMKHAQDKI